MSVRYSGEPDSPRSGRSQNFHHGFVSAPDRDVFPWSASSGRCGGSAGPLVPGGRPLPDEHNREAGGRRGKAAEGGEDLRSPADQAPPELFPAASLDRVATDP